MGEVLSNIHPLEKQRMKKKSSTLRSHSYFWPFFLPLWQQVGVDEWCGSCNQQLSDTGGANHQSCESPS